MGEVVSRVERAIRYTERWDNAALAWGLAVTVVGFWFGFAVVCYLIWSAV